MAAAEAQLVAANANIREARANFFPQITLTGSVGLESAALTAITGPGSLLINAAASASQTIFDNGLKGGQYEQFKARYDELVADYRKSIVQALTDVQNALDAYRLATEQERLEQPCRERRPARLRHRARAVDRRHQRHRDRACRRRRRCSTTSTISRKSAWRGSRRCSTSTRRSAAAWEPGR